MSLSPGPSIRTFEATQLLSSFTDFLTIAIHSLLYHRALYPPATFLTARVYNLPVHQSRYPRLCAWINDAVAAVSIQLQSARVRRVVFVVHAPASLDVLERWVFDVDAFPDWGPPLVVGEKCDAEDDDLAAAIAESEGALNWTDINEALRGALGRIAYTAESMPHPPAGSTFTLAIELRNEADAPIGVSQPPQFCHVRATDRCQAPTTLDPITARSTNPRPLQTQPSTHRSVHHPSKSRHSRPALLRVLGRAGTSHTQECKELSKDMLHYRS